MSRKRWLQTLAPAVLLTACFHQVVQTGRTPGPTVVEKQWVNTFIFGLVAAQPIDVRQQCPNGVATIETQESFANGLVGVLTLGIYTPQSVKVTCAAPGGSPLPMGSLEVQIPKTASREQSIEIETEAIKTVIRTHHAVTLRF
jgi:hypothetical protein